jgi:flagellar motor switch protein FliN
LDLENNMSDRDNLDIPAAEEKAVSSENAPELPEHGDVPAQPVEIAADEPRKPQPVYAPGQEKEKDFHADAQSRVSEDFGLALLLDIPLEIKVELGRAKIRIHELLKLAPGSAIKLTTLDGDRVDILANDTLIARGEVVVQKEKYGIRVTEIASRTKRSQSLGA